VPLLAQYYYLIRTDVGPPWRDFLLGQIQAIVFVPRLFIQGSVLRELAAGSWVLALYTAAVIAAVVLTALWLNATDRLGIRDRGGGGRPRSGRSGRPEHSVELAPVQSPATG